MGASPRCREAQRSNLSCGRAAATRSGSDVCCLTSKRCPISKHRHFSLPRPSGGNTRTCFWHFGDGFVSFLFPFLLAPGKRAAWPCRQRGGDDALQLLPCSRGNFDCCLTEGGDSWCQRFGETEAEDSDLGTTQRTQIWEPKLAYNRPSLGVRRLLPEPSSSCSIPQT